MSAQIEPETRVADGELVLPEPVGKQVEWLNSPASRKLLRVGRRGMKTRFAFIASLLGHGPGWEDGTPEHRGVLQGGDVVWCSPTYGNLTTVLWREEIVPRMEHLPWIKLDKQLHDVNVTGVGALLLRSGDREAIDAVRGVGKRLLGVIIDEAAWLDLRGALQDVILPALLDNGGWLVLMHLRFAAMPFLLQVEKAKMRSAIDRRTSSGLRASTMPSRKWARRRSSSRRCSVRAAPPM